MPGSKSWGGEADRRPCRSRNGDTTAGAVTVYRIEDGAAKVLDVLRPRPSQVRGG